MKPTIDDVQVVLARFDESDWDELRIDVDDFHLHVYKTPHTDRPLRESSTGSQASTMPPAAAHATTTAVADGEGNAGGTTQTQNPQTHSVSADSVVVRAPTLGTFYRAPKPGAAPFVEIGDEVDSGTQLCLLEVMKLYTPVEAGQRGVVTEVLVEDGELVEHDQDLFVIRPHGG